MKNILKKSSLMVALLFLGISLFSASCSKDDSLYTMTEIKISPNANGLSFSADQVLDLVIMNESVRAYHMGSGKVTITNNKESGEEVTISYYGKDYVLNAGESRKFNL